MKTSIFIRPSYLARVPGLPAPPRLYDRKIGLDSYNKVVELMEMAEDLGFDWITVAEHHYSGSMMSPNPILLAANLARQIKRARISVLGPIVPMLNPIRVAEELAMLDNLTEGRLTVGFVRGTTGEFQTYGVNPGETPQRLLEGIELILRAWSEPEPFSWIGRFFEYRQVSTWPQPCQEPHPPIYVLSSSKESCEFAAKNRLGIGVSHHAFSAFSEAIEYYREQCHRAGWEPEPERVLYRGTLYVAETQQEVEEFRDSLRRRGHANPLDRLIPISVSVDREVNRLDPSRYARNPHWGEPEDRPLITFAGTPEEVTQEILRCNSVLGTGVVDLIPLGPNPDRLTASIKLFAREVMPIIRGV